MGSPLREGDRLEVKTAEEKTVPEFQIPLEQLLTPPDPSLFRVLLGPQEDRFSEEGTSHFLNGVYRIKAQSDRMAYRLEGPKITPRKKADIISEPLMPGAVQVPNDGSPIILMVDGQTTGGYAKVANVISADISRLGQKAPGEQVRFEAVDLEKAYEALEQQERFLLWLKRTLSSA